MLASIISRRSPFVFVPVLALAAFGCAATGGGGDDTDEGDGVKGAGLTDSVYTEDGWMSLDDEYVPRVCTQENGAADYEALKVQAVAARTYLLRAMRDDSKLGTTAKPVGNGEFFQAYASTASQACIDATNETRGLVGKYQGQFIIANYVAGSKVNADGSKGNDYSSTEKWVTYNEGKTGKDVTPTKLSYTSRTDNRGCMGQNRSDWLAKQGKDYVTILRYFYGADLEVSSIDGSGPVDPGGDPGGSADPCGGLDYKGACEGSVIKWCEKGQLQVFDCANKGQTCAWQDDTTGNNCVAGSAPPPADCDGLGYAGACDGNTLSWCENGAVKNYDCGEAGLVCKWQDNQIGNNCL
jgi:hypothetical protein